jgi:hypothetical protein
VIHAAAAEGRRDGRTMPAELGLDRAKISVGSPGLSSTGNVTCAKRRLTPLAGTLRQRGVVECWVSPKPKIGRSMLGRRDRPDFGRIYQDPEQVAGFRPGLGSPRLYG